MLTTVEKTMDRNNGIKSKLEKIGFIVTSVVIV